MSMFGNTPPQTTDPMELFEYFMEQKRQKSLPKGEQSEGIFNKPIQDSASGALDFFTDMYEKITSKSQQAKEELQPDMEELARQSAEEAALYRMEAGIKESLRPKPTSLLSRGKSLRPQTFDDITGGLSEPEGEETLPAEPEVNLESIGKADLQETSSTGIMSKAEETPGSDMTLDEFMEKQISKHEGKKNYPYKDTEGKWTIGIGHLIGDGSDAALAKSGYAKYSKDNPMPDEKVSDLFSKDLEKHRKIAESYPFYEEMNEEGKKAIIDLTFNMGDFYNKKNEDGTYVWEDLREQLKNGEWDAAADNLASSLYARQVGDRAITVTNQLRKAGG